MASCDWEEALCRRTGLAFSGKPQPSGWSNTLRARGVAGATWQANPGQALGILWAAAAPPNGLELSRPDALGSPLPTLQQHQWGFE